MKTFKHHTLLGFLFLGLLLATISSCKTCNCPAYSLQQVPPPELIEVCASPTG